MEKYLKYEFTKNPYTITIKEMEKERGEIIFNKYYEHPIDWISAINFLLHNNENTIKEEIKKIIKKEKIY